MVLRNFIILLVVGGIVGYLLTIIGEFAAERSQEFIVMFLGAVLLGGGIAFLLKK